MNTITAEKLNKRQFKLLIKESVKEAIDTEFMKIKALLLLSVSTKEQKEIEKLYKKPTRAVSKTYKMKV